MDIDMNRGRLLLAFAAAATVAALALAQGNAYLPVGEAAPAISGTGTDGKAYSIPNKGKPSYVIFWKERCPHNKRASALFNALNKAYEGKVQVVGVVNASADGAKAWVEQFSLNYPLLADPDKATIGAYKLRYSITSMEIGADGKVAKVFEGYGADSIKAMNEAMAAAAGVKPAEIDLSGAPGRLTWG